MRSEHFIPIVLAGAETPDSGIESHHLPSQIFPGAVGIEATVGQITLSQECGEPAWVGASSGGGDSPTSGVQQEAADGVDGRFAQDDGSGSGRVQGEVAEILPGAWRQAQPAHRSGAAQFGAHGLVFFAGQEEDVWP